MEQEISGKDPQTTVDKERYLVPSPGSSVAFEPDQTEMEKSISGMSSFLDLHKRMKEQRLVLAVWLMDLMNITKSTSRLKVILPYVINFDLVISSLPPVTNILYDLAERMRLRHIKGNTVSIRSLFSPICRNSLADFDPVVKLSTDLLVQSFVDLLEIHGVMDNCYIFLMETGGQDECIDTSIILPKKVGFVKKCLQIRKVKEDKRLAQWNKIYGNVKAPNCRITEVKHTESNKQKLDTTVALRFNPVITGASNMTHSTVGHNEGDPNVSKETRIDDIAKFEQKNQGKKKKDQKEKINGPLGVMNDKKGDTKGNVKTSSTKKMKKIFLSRKGNNKNIDCSVKSSSSNECSSKENLVQRKTSVIEKSRDESNDAKLSDSIIEEEPSTSSITNRGQQKKRMPGPSKSKRTQLDDGYNRISLNERIKIRLGLSKPKPCTETTKIESLNAKEVSTKRNNKKVENKKMNSIEANNNDKEQGVFFSLSGIEGEQKVDKKKKKLHLKRRLKKTFGIKTEKDQKVNTDSKVEYQNTASKPMSKALRNLNTEKRRLLYIVDEDHDVADDSISETDIHIGIVDDLGEVKDDKKKKHGLKRKVTAPFRWIKNKF